MSIDFSIKPFDSLSGLELYQILHARAQVFVVEQHCAYQDIDELDLNCLHLSVLKHEKLIGYCRIIPPEHCSHITMNEQPIPIIGRLLIKPEYRYKGIARQTMAYAIRYIYDHYSGHDIFISAQSYLVGFYNSLGFVTQGPVYLEDGIEHVDMLLKANVAKSQCR